jgi:hypothetical protein
MSYYSLLIHTALTRMFGNSIKIRFMERDLANRSPFLGAFTKLRKAIISFVMSICPSVCHSTWNNSAPTKRIFVNFVFLCFWKICRRNSSFFKI